MEVRNAVRELLADAAATLRAAGVDNPEIDAQLLLQAATGMTRTQLMITDRIGAAEAEAFTAMVRRRAGREPLQHITGTAYFRHVRLAVGPGVFVPRPETEVMTGWAIDRLREVQGRPPVVVDLCTGSGAIARALADEVPQASVHAVELGESAVRWATENLAGTGVELRIGDMADAFADLNGAVDVVTCNPPYIPLTAWESVQTEARDHDPELALFSGEDGLDAVRVLTDVAARLLRPGGWVACEHAEVQAESVPELFARHGAFTEVRDHRDLSGRPRFSTARRTAYER
ncbi:MAG TPA: peptide chain release factor N(5)-glutamine methyltransferase [Microlunatus sp.]